MPYFKSLKIFKNRINPNTSESKYNKNFNKMFHLKLKAPFVLNSLY